ncbi:endonuclease domain-containing protein [Catenuloplanes indicus]|uniref:Recombination endonuclease VII n=1 Tax=Catenuloplanes indicus TaxID=137267 RepID=A0AAE3W944_9ACTN|nr:endonuclease domain-containing protein [Catenuloplanes indicus]MDQ0371570.1 hypothetical protein [Catenuloplanes indicus]
MLFPTAFIPPHVEPRWWERDATSPEPTRNVTAAEHGQCPTHVKYALTCRQFDRLMARADNHCEACGSAPENSRFGRLAIDHVTKLGWWAVRGLLCTACNAALHVGALGLPRFREYVSNAFYLTLLAEAKVTDHVAEPPLGAVVLDAGGRPWRREQPARWPWTSEHRWMPRHRRYPQAPETWEWLTSRNGPHHLRVDRIESHLIPAA